ncbi:hypothetical protein Angca_000451, partial [Angiostrongylus cantonensis]
KPSILNRSTSVSYTSSTVHVVPVEHSFFSARRDTVKLSNIGAQNAVLSAKNGVSVQRRSKVQIIYTDHSLRESQSSQTDNISEQGDLFEDSMSENIEASTLWPETVALGDNDACGVNDEKVIHRSHSDVVQDVALSAEPVRSSLSSNCFAAMCSEHHATLNAYELCEQHSFTESKDLLCNVDFLCRLNFAAHRISEDIAEEAGRALRIHFRDQLNPRARYFKTSSLSNFSMSLSSLDDDLQSELGFTVEPAPRDVPSFGLFSFFAKKSNVSDRPKLSNPFISFPYTSSTETKSRRHSDDRSGDILNLLRRSSGADSRASTESPIKLPEHALEGLSQSELEHVMEVLSRSNRNTSPDPSRRSSSVLQMLPDMTNISPTERQHIQRVLMKAEQRIPYVIGKPLPRQLTSRTESVHSPEPIQLPVLNAEDTSNIHVNSVDDAAKEVEQ